MTRYDIVLGHYMFCLMHHTGQACPRYARLCRIVRYFKPGLRCSETNFLQDRYGEYEAAREVYYNLCERNMEEA